MRGNAHGGFGGAGRGDRLEPKGQHCAPVRPYSISLYGADDQVEAGFAAPRWGKPKDRRPDLKQVQTGLAVSGDGGVPVWHRAYDGGAGEVAQVVGAMEGLKALAGARKVLLVGDSKLISRGNILAMNKAKVCFIAPASKTYLPAEHLRALEVGAASPVDYLAERDQDLPPGQRGSYRVVEGGITLKAKRKTEPDLAVRCVFVWSSARAQAAAQSRAKKLDRARDDLARVQRGLGGRYYRTPEQVRQRIQVIARQRKVTALLRAEVGTDPTSGTPTLSWSFDQAALQAAQATDGWYGLLTNLTPAQADAAEVLRRYKGQEVVERRYGTFKGPLGVARCSSRPTAASPRSSPSSAWPCWCSAWSNGQSARPSPPPSSLPACMSAGPPSRPAGWCSKRWPGCASTPPTGTTPRPSPHPRRCRPSCCSCSRLTRPAHAGRAD